MLIPLYKYGNNGMFVLEVMSQSKIVYLIIMKIYQNFRFSTKTFEFCQRHITITMICIKMRKYTLLYPLGRSMVC